MHPNECHHLLFFSSLAPLFLSIIIRKALLSKKESFEELLHIKERKKGLERNNSQEWNDLIGFVSVWANPTFVEDAEIFIQDVEALWKCSKFSTTFIRDIVHQTMLKETSCTLRCQIKLACQLAAIIITLWCVVINMTIDGPSITRVSFFNICANIHYL